MLCLMFAKRLKRLAFSQIFCNATVFAYAGGDQHESGLYAGVVSWSGRFAMFKPNKPGSTTAAPCAIPLL